MRTTEKLYQILRDKYLILDIRKNLDADYMREKYKIVTGYGVYNTKIDRKKYKNSAYHFLVWEPNFPKYGRRPTYQEFIKMFNLETRARESAEITEVTNG